MDIYQILTEYNNPWSSREIFCFSCVMVIAVIMMIYLIRKEKMNKLQAAAILAELVFLGIVFGSTVFTRTGSVRQYELIPFWSWSAIPTTIETSQLITMRGLFEWDDMIHNGLGCMIGCVIVNRIIGIFTGKK